MADKRWKVHEREVARLLGGRRLPNNGTGQADVIAGNLAVEVKCHELPQWLTEALDQALVNAPDEMIPAVVLVESSQGRKARRVVVMDFERFQEMASAQDMHCL